MSEEDVQGTLSFPSDQDIFVDGVRYKVCLTATLASASRISPPVKSNVLYCKPSNRIKLNQNYGLGKALLKR